MYVYITCFATGITTGMYAMQYYYGLKQNWMEQCFLNQRKQKFKLVGRGVYVCMCAAV